jgi:hypothetical protein
VLPPTRARYNLDSLLQMCSETYGGTGDKQFLIDDCANQKDAKVKSCELTRLAFSGRHLGISVWFITLKYTAVVKDFRDNIRALVQFYEKDEVTLKGALSENGVIPKEQRQDVVERLKRGTPLTRTMWWIIDLVELGLKLVLWLLFSSVGYTTSCVTWRTDRMFWTRLLPSWGWRMLTTNPQALVVPPQSLNTVWP